MSSTPNSFFKKQSKLRVFYEFAYLVYKSEGRFCVHTNHIQNNGSINSIDMLLIL